MLSANLTNQRHAFCASLRSQLRIGLREELIYASYTVRAAKHFKIASDFAMGARYTRPYAQMCISCSTYAMLILVGAYLTQSLCSHRYLADCKKC